MRVMESGSWVLIDSDAARLDRAVLDGGQDGGPAGTRSMRRARTTEGRRSGQHEPAHAASRQGDLARWRSGRLGSSGTEFGAWVLALSRWASCEAGIGLRDPLQHRAAGLGRVGVLRGSSPAPPGSFEHIWASPVRRSGRGEAWLRPMGRVLSRLVGRCWSLAADRVGASAVAQGHDDGRGRRTPRRGGDTRARDPPASRSQSRPVPALT